MEQNKSIGTLPEGWIWTTLDSIAANITDGSHNPPSKQNQGIPMLSARNIENGKISFDEVRFISENEFEYENQRTRIEAGDVLLTIVATIGRSAIVPRPLKQQFALQRSVAVIKPLINGQYLTYVFQGPVFQKLLIDNAKGTAQKGVYLKTLRELSIPLPPLEEQHRIVARIEELFSELDHAEDELKKAQKRLEIYKQALLKSAFDGKLTEKWREENLEYDAIDQLKKIKGERNFSSLALNNRLSTRISFRRSPIISTWASATLENLIGIYARIGWRGLTKDEYTENGPLFLSVYSLNYGKTVVFHQANHISIERYDESPEIKLQLNDILLCKDGAGIGKVGIVKHLPDKATVNSSLLVIRSFEAFVPDFLYYLFLGPSMQKLVAEKISGSAIPHLFQKDIKQFTLQVPPFEEQQQIVQELESHFALTNELESAIEKGLFKIKVFRQAVLKKAFDGRLQPQFPHEEPANKLLQTIHIEKENYLLEQKAVERQKPRKDKPMETNKSILEVLQDVDGPISAKDVWLSSKYKDNIDDFYKELKEIFNVIKESKNLISSESFISLKK